MLISEKKSPVMEKTEELCQTLLEQPLFQQFQENVGAFMADEEAQALYRHVVELQDDLQAKQGGGVALSPEEIQAFEKQRDALMNHAVAGAFVESQQQMHQVQDTIQRHLQKTIELGRLPVKDDFQSGGCCGGGGGGGCSCGG